MRPPRHFLGTAWWASEHGLFQTGACDALLTQVNMFSERRPRGSAFGARYTEAKVRTLARLTPRACFPLRRAALVTSR